MISSHTLQWVKLALLAFCLGVCFISYVMSPNTTLGHAPLQVLRPMPRKHCRLDQSEAMKCPKEDTACHQRVSQAMQTCHQVVKLAYQHVNLGGCPLQLQAVSLCQAEWCSHSNSIQSLLIQHFLQSISDLISNYIALTPRQSRRVKRSSQKSAP